MWLSWGGGGESYPWDDREVGSFLRLGEWIRVQIIWATEIGGTFDRKREEEIYSVNSLVIIAIQLIVW